VSKKGDVSFVREREREGRGVLHWVNVISI
jgi:hypothetical protein